MSWYLKVLKQYFDFKGRARRKEYWMFTLFNMIVGFILGLFDGFLGLYIPAIGIGILGGIYVLGILIPSFAVSVRRLHDIGKSGWWLLLLIIPLIGAIVILVFCCLDSQEGENKYGENPKNEFE